MLRCFPRRKKKENTKREHLPSNLLAPTKEQPPLYLATKVRTVLSRGIHKGGWVVESRVTMNTQSPDPLNSEAPLSASLHRVEREKAQGSKSTSSVKSPGSAEEASTTITSPGTGAKDDGKLKAVPDTPDSKASTPKKKRKSPEKPWKKPPDMPRRPLSAYNLCKISH